MEGFSPRCIVVVCAWLLLLGGSAASAEKPFEAARKQALERCQGKFKDKEPTPAEIEHALNDHRVWDKAYSKWEKGVFGKGVRTGTLSKEALADPRRANLCGAFLAEANLSGAELYGANLSGAFLSRANLSGANLWQANLNGAFLLGANLSGASLYGANLSGASLLGANLSGASLGRANLSGTELLDVNLHRAYLLGANLSGASLAGANLSEAHLYGANLSEAHLYGANLRGVILREANLRGANLHSADLNGVLFEPKVLPAADAIAEAMNLALMRYEASPEALIKLRKAFKETGFYEQERKITYAIKHSATLKALGAEDWGPVGSLIEGTFSYIFFDRTTLWGMAPGRALLILLGLIPAFAVPYVIALIRPGVNGIWRKWSDDRIRTDVGTKEPTLLRVGWSQALTWGLYFSVLSAFNIGWRELNVGNWIQRLQANEYTLRATGWVRTVAGVQSLVSVYLLAMWALTYFSRPFE